MFYQSVMTLVPAITVMAVASAVIYIGFLAVSCTVARMQGKECPSC
jgi:hypothetical protein